jgi:hypothetical protein
MPGRRQLLNAGKVGKMEEEKAGEGKSKDPYPTWQSLSPLFFVSEFSKKDVLS